MNLTLKQIQEIIKHVYFKRDSKRGLWRTLLWLCEEIGELISALNKEEDIEKAKEELADVLAWTVSVANLLGIDLEEAFSKKYKQDIERYMKYKQEKSS